MKKLFYLLVTACLSLSYTQEKSVEELNHEWQQLKSRLPKVLPSRAKNGTGLFAFGDFLYWRATEDQLTLVLKERATSAITFQDTFLELDPSYDLGFRLGLGYHFPEVAWDLNLVWTHYKTDANLALQPEPFVQYFSLIGAPANPDLFDPIAGMQNWTLDYHTVDLMLAPNFIAFKQFSFQPRVGFRASWINQFLIFDGIAQDVPAIFAFGVILSPASNLKMRSLAIEIGSKMRWSFVEWFHIIGELQTGLGYSRQRVKSILNFIITSQDNPFQIKIGERINRIRPNVQFAIGLEANPSFFNDRLKVHLTATYEQIIWFDYNMLFGLYGDQGPPGSQPRIDYDLHRDDLQLSGLTVGAGIDF